LALSLDGRLNAALRYGGDRAVFSHTTAAWIWSLTEAQPSHIHLTVPGRQRSLPVVRIHHSRGIDRATWLSPRQLRRALSEADYRGLLELGDLEQTLRRGRVGSKALRAALQAHMPGLAQTRSVLEERFLEAPQLTAAGRRSSATESAR
jgi:hypothetical protein